MAPHLKTKTNPHRRVEFGRRDKEHLVLAVDIGGTKVEAALVSQAGKIVLSGRRPMAAKGGASEGLRAVRATIDGVLGRSRGGEIRAIGVSVPGWVDANTGKVLKAANLPCWRDYPLAQKLQDLCDLPTRIANDANAAAMAEARWGAGRRYKSFFYVSLGTGIGTGVVQDTQGSPHTPSSEGGHVTINYRGPLCPCGKRGCIEMYASGKALARRATHLLAQRGARGSLLRTLARESGVNAELVGRAAAGGDRVAVGILEEACDHLTVWLGNIIDLLEPEAIVFGGGLGRLMLSYAPRIRRRLKTFAIRPNRAEIPIVGARFGSQSALLGAAALWLQE
jgi:glucokinase